MTDHAINVEGLSKLYRLGETAALGRTFREMIYDRVGRLTRRSPQDESDQTLWALRDVSFDVDHGEVVGIIGRNGAGKSTLLKVLSRITDPTEGRAVIRGRLGSLLEVGTGFHPELTGRENIYLNGAILGMKKAEIDRKFDEIVAFSEIERFLDTPAKRYSSGMYVRLAFAVAAHLEPEIMIVDEVLAVGDAGFQKKCLGKMRDVATGGRTILFVSHNMAAVQTLCTRCVVIDGGELVFDGGVKDAIERYTSLVENLVEGTPLDDRTDRRGSGAARFTDVEVLDGDSGAPVPCVYSGQAVAFRVHYDNPGSRTIENVSFTISMFNQTSQFMFACRSDSIGVTFALPPGKGSFVCTVPRWPLNQGRYVFNLGMNIGREPLDYVNEAGVVDVEIGDFYGTGRLPGAKRCGVFIDYGWQEAHAPSRSR